MARRTPYVRHYKTTTRRVGNTTYRTVQSRGNYWGPYRTPGDGTAGFWAIAFFAVVTMWPFCLNIKGSTEFMIALAWWGLLALVIIQQKRKEKRGKKPKRPFV